jgi:PilZ domain
MSLASDTSAGILLDSPPAAALDRRRHKRVKLTLLGRFMRETKQEYPCKLIDVSVGGAAMNAPTDVEIGERIVAYFDHLGGVEGKVVRVFEGGFAIELKATPYKREKLAAQITWLANRSQIDGLSERRHERFAAESKPSSLTLSGGAAVPVRIIDVSISGASVAIDTRPPIGSEVVLGRLRAKVVRHHAEGIGLEFSDIQNPDAVRRYFR